MVPPSSFRDSFHDGVWKPMYHFVSYFRQLVIKAARRLLPSPPSRPRSKEPTINIKGTACLYSRPEPTVSKTPFIYTGLARMYKIKPAPLLTPRDRMNKLSLLSLLNTARSKASHWFRFELQHGKIFAIPTWVYTLPLVGRSLHITPRISLCESVCLFTIPPLSKIRRANKRTFLIRPTSNDADEKRTKRDQKLPRNFWRHSKEGWYVFGKPLK